MPNTCFGLQISLFHGMKSIRIKQCQTKQVPRYIKRLLKRYNNTGELKTHLLINHFIILYNIFGDAATPMFFYKIEDNLWSSVKTFIVFLDRLPEYPHTYIHEIPLDQKCWEELEKIADG